MMKTKNTISTVLLAFLTITLGQGTTTAVSAELPLKKQELPALPKAYEPKEERIETIDNEFEEMLSNYREELVEKERLLGETKYFLRSVIYEHNLGRLSARHNSK